LNVLLSCSLGHAPSGSHETSKSVSSPIELSSPDVHAWWKAASWQSLEWRRGRSWNEACPFLRRWAQRIAAENRKMASLAEGTLRGLARPRWLGAGCHPDGLNSCVDQDPFGELELLHFLRLNRDQKVAVPHPPLVISRLDLRNA
jgi:hypothetical protein